MTSMPLGDELANGSSSQFDDVATHRLTPALFDQICAGAATADAMAVLLKTQYSQRKLALRALADQLLANPGSVGPMIQPEQAWQLLAAAERRDADAFADVILYPPVGVWLTRALHYTRPDRAATIAWHELGYLQLIAAACAIRCRVGCALSVPVWHGAIALPTVGQIRLRTSFPIGAAELRYGARAVQIRAGGWRLDVDLDQAPVGSTFSPAIRQVSISRGLRLETYLDDLDPYRGLGAPQPPGQLDQVDLAEWHKLIGEAWDVLTLRHPEHARELAAGLRMLAPIDARLGILGASSPAAFGGIVVSANGSAIELAEALVHEIQHSKLNALLRLVPLADDGGERRFYAPWRDDPRPLTALLHGVYAFTGGLAFWLAQRDLFTDAEARHAEFTFAFRRHQLRTAVDFLLANIDLLSRPGRRLLEALVGRLEHCEQTSVSGDLPGIVDATVSDHYAHWRLRWIRPESTTVESLCAAWLAGEPATPWSTDHGLIPGYDRRPLPGHRRALLRTKATDPELFGQLASHPETLPGTTPRADAAFCVGHYDDSMAGYRDRIRADPEDSTAWIGFGLAMRALGQSAPAQALLAAPEVSLAVHRKVRALGAERPDPDTFARWLGSGL